MFLAENRTRTRSTLPSSQSLLSTLEGCSPIIFGDGEQSRDFTYVDNVVQANLLAMSVERLQGEAINIACGERISLNQLLGILKEILGSMQLPIYEEPRQGDVKHSLADIRKGKEVLNYEPRVGIEVGLEKTVEFFQKVAEVKEKARRKN